MRKSSTNVYLGYLFASTYLCALLLIAFTSVKMGLSHYYADVAIERNSEDEAAKAIYYEPADPEAYEIRATISQSNGNIPEAVNNFRRTVELCEGDFLLWLRLGHALVEAGDNEAARSSYARAISLAPNYAKPNRYMGRLLLTMGKRDEAFGYLSKAAEQDNSIYPEILQLARKEFPDDPEAIERAVSPRSREARKATARYLIKYYLTTNAVQEFLTGNELNEAEKIEFVRYLIYKKSPRIAHEMWLTTSVPVITKAANDDLIFDGGFEAITTSDAGGFGWQIDQGISDTAVAIDTKLFHSGSRSLHVKFAGQVDPGKKILSQLVVVEPNQNYRLTFAVRSAELTTVGFPIVVVEAGSTRSYSDPIKATGNRWVTFTVDFRTGNDATALISLQRSNCNASLCPIFGELSLDEFSLKEVG